MIIPLRTKNNLYFDRIPGSYDQGIIGAFFDAEEFNKHKKNYPALKNIQLKMDDNPILVFFEMSQ